MDRKLILFAALAVAAAMGVAVRIHTSPLKAPPDIEVVRVGVLPSNAEAQQVQRYAPFLAYLSQETGWPFRIVVASSYENLLDLFGARQVDLANFGGFTFIKAHALYGASPLVMRDTDSRVTTYIVVKAGGPLETCFDLKCDDLAHRTALFGPELSTSGHLMPLHFLKTEKGIEAKAFFGNVRYSTGHRATIEGVRNGDADLGIVHAEVYRAMLRDGDLKDGELRVIWETPPYPDSVFATQEHMDEQIRTKLRDAFLALDPMNEDHRRTLATVHARSFIPAATSEFLPLARIADSLGLMRPEDPQ